ncbi:phosphatidylserine decarboxylase proenzyme, mitochondrial isoform X2 [Hyalella azteca]|nr:phosphatidylserine decarboxylase proenzyme, mitochondrial isoform X2 [Hyalella azteca]
MASFTRYLRSLKWTPLPLGVGFAVIAATQYRHTRKREEQRLAAEGAACIARPWEVQVYKLLPLRHFSRFWGWINDIELPLWCRSTVLGSYVRTFGCDMTEAEVEDILQYNSLSSLFRRSLKPSSRPVNAASALTSPVDGTILQAGRVSCGTLHQIKGVTYSLGSFLGPNIWSGVSPDDGATADDSCYHNSCITDPDANELHQVVLYLAPGDYHRFHSPADWKVIHRRHFPGELLSVNPSFAAWIPNLFVLNERVAYIGTWKYGFFSMTAVGATNVGSVKTYFDEDLRTNERCRPSCTFSDKTFEGPGHNFTFSKGAPFGEFNLGSTIVLLFEAPKNSVMSVLPGQKIKMGEALLAPETFTDKTAGSDKDCVHNKGVER